MQRDAGLEKGHCLLVISFLRELPPRRLIPPPLAEAGSHSAFQQSLARGTELSPQLISLNFLGGPPPEQNWGSDGEEEGG